MGTMLIPDHTGHSTLTWTLGDPPTEAVAVERFEQLLSARMAPFRHDGAQQYSPLADFDATVDEILWVRPLQGG